MSVKVTWTRVQISVQTQMAHTHAHATLVLPFSLMASPVCVIHQVVSIHHIREVNFYEKNAITIGVIFPFKELTFYFPVSLC